MEAKEKAYAWVDEHREGMMELWKDMVTIDSGIGVKKGGMAMGDLCAGILVHPPRVL